VLQSCCSDNLPYICITVKWKVVAAVTGLIVRLQQIGYCSLDPSPKEISVTTNGHIK
jgi:hypothetical protein